MRFVGFVSVILLAACGSDAPPGEASPDPSAEEAFAPIAASDEDVREAASAPESASAEPAAPALVTTTTLANAGAETCTVNEPVRVGRGSRGVGIAATEEGGLVAFGSGRNEVTVQPITAQGETRGPPATMRIPQLEAVFGVAFLGDARLLIATGHCPDGPGVCTYAQPLGADGAPTGEPVTRPERRTGAWYEVRHRASLADETGLAVWFWWELDTSHAGGGMLIQRMKIAGDGQPNIGERRHLVGGAGEGELTGAIFSATPEHYAALFGWYGDVYDQRRDTFGTVRRRELSLDGADLVVAHVGGAIRDFVLTPDGELHILWAERNEAFHVGLLGTDGHLVGEPVDLDLESDTPLPAPFTDRVLPRLHYSYATETLSLRRFRPTGQRIGAPIPLGRGASDLAFTGARFLTVVGGAREAADVVVTSIACAPRESL